MKKVLKQQAGFTLIEVLVSLTILAVGMLAVASMQTTAMSGNKISQEATIASELAEEMAERVRANGGTNPAIYNSLDTGGDCTSLADPAKGECLQWQERLAQTQSGLSNATGQVQVSAETPIPNTATITVTVNWSGGKTVTFTTIMETWGT